MTLFNSDSDDFAIGGPIDPLPAGRGRRWRSAGTLALLLGGVLAVVMLAGPPAVRLARGETKEGTLAADQEPAVAVPKLAMSDDEWRKLLTDEQFEILRHAGTEPPYHNRYFNFHGVGTYACAACGNRLFLSTAKFESGTGWPSFFKPIDDAAVVERPDNTLSEPRIEIVCSRCGGHLGHVFKDGPQPTGLRYCMNSGALAFFPDTAPQGAK
jgi:peptide-methionine (R)-S-oxide reductase